MKRANKKRTTRRASLEEDGELVISFRKPITTYLWALHHTGLYGLHIGETVDRAVCETLNREVARGFIPSMEFDDAGLCTKVHPLRVSSSTRTDR